MGRRHTAPGRRRKKTATLKSTLPIAYRYCRRCRRQRIYVNGHCSACA